MRKRVAILAGALLAIGIALIAWRVGEDRPTRRHSPMKSRLDVAAFRTQLALRVKRAKEIAARGAPPRRPTTQPRSKAWASKGKGPMKAVKDMINPGTQCWAGPTALCDALKPLADDCSEGDARSCIAIGQYLSETPPRLLVARFFFHAACRIGDEDGCTRLDALEPGAPGTCEEDPFACQWRAYEAEDMVMHEQACALGAAESCAVLAFEGTDGDKRLAYYETSCQLGNTQACDGLVTLTSPDCEDGDADLCLPINEEASARAKEIACAAGFTERC